MEDSELPNAQKNPTPVTVGAEFQRLQKTCIPGCDDGVWGPTTGSNSP